MKTKPKLEPWMSAFERLTGAKFVTVKAIGQDETVECDCCGWDDEGCVCGPSCATRATELDEPLQVDKEI